MPTTRTTTPKADPVYVVPAGVEFEKLGENVRVAVNGDDIVIVMQKDHRNDVPDKDGLKKKTIRVASTLGNKEVDGSAGDDGLNVILGINAYTYRQAR